jgi:hypothetical protein
VNSMVGEAPKKVKELSSLKAHCQLGHLLIQATKDAAAQLGWYLKGDFERCEDCAIRKGRQKNVNKTTDQGSDWKIPVQFEFTGRDTPQQNHLAEVAFSTIAGRGRAMMSATKVPKCYRENFWREAFQTTTFLDGLTVIELKNKKLTRFEQSENQLPSFVKNLREWGEVGSVKLRTSTTPKIYDRGKPCMFVGYCLNHAGDTFRMWDPDTKRVHLSRDIVWTGKMYFNTYQSTIEGPLIPNFHNASMV